MTTDECEMSRRWSRWESQLVIAWQICATGVRELGRPGSFERRKEDWTRMGCGIAPFLSLLLREWVTLNKGPNIHIAWEHVEDTIFNMLKNALLGQMLLHLKLTDCSKYVLHLQ